MDFDSYFLGIADAVALKSNCVRRHFGAVIVKDNRILTTGYNGTPKGWTNCNDGGCSRCNDKNAVPGEQYEYCLCVHAEANAVLAAARFGISTDGSVLYTQETPCDLCIKELVQCGIIKVVSKEGVVWIGSN